MKKLPELGDLIVLADGQKGRVVQRKWTETKAGNWEVVLVIVVLP